MQAPDGLLYVVPAEASWVCTPELVHAHALAGLLKELTQLRDPRVEELMQKWGVYYRERPLAEAEQERSGKRRREKRRAKGPPVGPEGLFV